MSLSVSKANAFRLYQNARARRLSNSDVTSRLALDVQRLSALKVPEAKATVRPVLPFTPTRESTPGSMSATGTPSSFTSIGADQICPPSVENRILESLAWLSRQSITRRQAPRGVPASVATGGEVPLDVTAPIVEPVTGTRSETTTGT